MLRFLSTAGLVIMTAATAPVPSQAAMRVLVPCAYPHGWNSTDAHRELAGIPKGRDHQCWLYRDANGRTWREPASD
jgi:hypothetical protein